MTTLRIVGVTVIVTGAVIVFLVRSRKKTKLN